MQDIAKIIEKISNSFTTKNILIIGDLMVDEYVTGNVSRISPEAPVPVLTFINRTLKAGGASNVANNISALGGTAYLVGVIADDMYGQWLKSYLKEKHVHIDGMVSEKDRPTIIKTRFATKGQQLLRVDNEVALPIIEETQNAIVKALERSLSKFDAVILSDYKKGVLNDIEFVKKIIKLCHAYGKVVAVDSKSSAIEAFAGAEFVKPNNLELEAAVGIRITDENTFNMAGNEYLNKSHAKALIVTRGAKGISLFMPKQKRKDFPAAEVQVYDVTGAGDTVISTITLGIVSGLSIEESIWLANIAAGKVISSVGTVPIYQQDLLDAIMSNKERK